MFPDNLPLPSNTTSARLLGGAMHFLHLCVRIHQIQRVPASELDWADMYREDEDDSWLHWVRALFGFISSTNMCIERALFIYLDRCIYAKLGLFIFTNTNIQPRTAANQPSLLPKRKICVYSR